jgi:hypothetical protein
LLASARLPRTVRQVGDWMHSTSLSLTIPRFPSRPSSTASNRSTPSIRARSPSLLPDDTGKSVPLSRNRPGFYSAGAASLPSNTVSIRHHMSTLKHSIRHQQAQLQNLENLLQLAPRMPMSINTSSSPPPSPLPPPDPSDHSATTPNRKVRRRSSFDILHSLAGPDSNLPLPRREPGQLSQDGIREGVPKDFGVSPTSQSYKHRSSPTRTLSRACYVPIIQYPASLTYLASRYTGYLCRFVYSVSFRFIPSAYGFDPKYNICRKRACPRR